MAYTKTKTVNTNWSLSNYQGFNSDPLSLTAQAGGSVSIVDEFTGEQNPGWHLKLRHSLPATTIASGVKKEVRFGRHSLYSKVRREFDGQVSARLSVGELDWEQVVPTTAPDDADSRRQIVANTVLAEFIKRAKKKQRQIQSGVFFGELRQTLNLIRRPLLLVRAGLDSYVANVRKLRNLKNLTRAMSNEWLQYQFGIKPLISDIEGFVSSLVRYQHKRVVERISFVGGDEVSRGVTMSNPVVYTNLVGYTRMTCKIWRYERKLIGAVYVEPDGPIAVQQSWGLGTRDFVPTIYELIPYSFLVDYFVNIGGIIDAWSFNQADLAWHNDTLREELLTEVTVNPVLIKEFGGLTLLDSHLTLSPSYNRIKSFTRRADPLGLPSLEFRLPGLGTKALNIAALAGLRVR